MRARVFFSGVLSGKAGQAATHEMKGHEVREGEAGVKRRGGEKRRREEKKKISSTRGYYYLIIIIIMYKKSRNEI